MIEHRLFSQITKNWQATPLIDYETVLKYTKSTKTTTGLRVNAMLVDKKYKKGIKASKDDLKKRLDEADYQVLGFTSTTPIINSRLTKKVAPRAIFFSL